MVIPNQSSERPDDSGLKEQTPATITQRRTRLSHPKLAMKKLSLAALILFAFFILSSVTGVAAAAEKVAGKFAGRVMFFVHVAQLYTEDADKKLAMPIKDVSTKQIANNKPIPEIKIARRFIAYLSLLVGRIGNPSYGSRNSHGNCKRPERRLTVPGDRMVFSGPRSWVTANSKPRSDPACISRLQRLQYRHS